MDNEDKKYTPEQVGEAIAKEKTGGQSDKYSKHVAEGGREDFKKYAHDVPVTSRKDYEIHAVETMTSEDTQTFHADTVGWDFYYRTKTNLFVGVDINNLEKSTFFPPSQGEVYFKRQQENELKRGGDPERCVIKEGGHKTLYPEQYVEKSEAVEMKQPGTQKYQEAQHEQPEPEQLILPSSNEWEKTEPQMPPQAEPVKAPEAQEEQAPETKPVGEDFSSLPLYNQVSTELEQNETAVEIYEARIEPEDFSSLPGYEDVTAESDEVYGQIQASKTGQETTEQADYSSLPLYSDVSADADAGEASTSAESGVEAGDGGAEVD